MFILPGSAVRVINPADIFYGYQGLVQRIVDGKVAVLDRKSTRLNSSH